MRGLYGSMLNVLHLMRTRTLVIALLLAGAAIAAYLVGNVSYARNAAQLLVLVFIPLVTVWTARLSYSSKWNIFEQSWSASLTVMIVSRYIIFALINLIMSVLWYLSPLFDGDYGNLVHTMGSAYLTLAIYYPIMYLLRGEKGDLDQIIFMASMVGSILGLGWFAIRFGSEYTIVLVVSAYLISLGLSIGFNRFHKGRAT
ncbi:MAG: hypothetical protein FWB91_02420 [Defluviitaleaceae bacterium]|nr:hypothetical protein [Defluviitaleaceae bacterium]